MTAMDTTAGDELVVATEVFDAADASPAAAKRDRRRRFRVTPGRIVTHILLMAGSLFMILPFYWMIVTSLKGTGEIARFPPSWIPTSWRFANYSEALDAAPFHYYFRNSLIRAGTHTVTQVILGSLGGYALARIRFRGREIVFIGIVAMLMMPTYTIIVTQFLMVKKAPLFGGNDILGVGGTGWLDTWWALLIPGALSPMTVFLFRQFYLSLPRELEEAARLDGLSEFQTYLRIMTPLVKPAIITIALLRFQESWNNFLWPLLVTTREDLRVIQLGLAVFRQSDQTSWAYLMAGTTLATLPIILLFIVGQKYFIQGINRSGLKG